MAHCLSGTPLSEEDYKGRRGAALAKYASNPNTFRVAMVDAPLTLETCPCCVAGAIPLLNCCATVHLRHKALNHLSPGSGWDHYECCQGYVPECCCFKPGACFERECPRAAMSAEAWCCPGLAISATRFLLMDEYGLQPDPCDNRLIRLNNCLQLARCVCDVAAAFDRNLRDCAQLLDCVAELAFWSTAGCMVAQIDAELNHRGAANAANRGADDAYSPLAAEDAAPPPQLPIEGRF
mmetsp:Transcript_4061/g.13360  ORF Transcript_4061/g.13360 Transcript_4061/m.13360 type:complete len:237 (+) Transcript_4061:204-914(+)